jgi:uncharacterized repeat protein (TIGR01451 family)
MQTMDRRSGTARAWALRALWGLASWACLPGALSGAASLSNLLVPGSATAGQDVTVSFDIGPGCSYVAIALSPFSSFVCPSTNGYPYPWVLHDSVHYATALDSAPDFRGLFGGGLYAGCGPATLSYVVRIPPDAPTPIYAHVFADDATMAIWGNNPCSYDARLDSPAIAVSGSDSSLRVDLLSQRATGGEPGNVYQLIPSIRNWGTWPVASTRFCVRMSVFEPASPVISALGGGHYNIATNSGVNWGPAAATPWTGSVSYSGTAQDCGSGRQANWTLQSCFSGAARYIPGNGGYLKPGNDGDSANAFWAGGSSFSKGDDYSQASMLGIGFAGRAQDPHYRLYDGGALVCEHDSATTQDPQSGQDPCGISACVTPTPTPTLTPSPSPTPTPRMALTKTVDRARAVVGDTITYCLHWSNDSSSAQPIVLWDTLHPVLSYVGADPAPAVSGSYLRWDLGAVAAGASGQICFWARITGYP